MPGIRLEVDTFEWQYVRTRYAITLTEDQLGEVLSGLEAAANPLLVEAKELIDYLDTNKGQLAFRVALAGDERKLANVINAVGVSAFCGDLNEEFVIDECLDSKGIESLQCDTASVVP